MKQLPTDLEILNMIYERYYESFTTFTQGDNSRSAKIYVPIDINRVAEDLNIDGDIVFGRLYYHLEKKYGYRQDNGSLVHFFSLRIGSDIHCINFPLASAVLADLRDQAKKYNWAKGIAIVSLFISLISIFISIID